MHCQDGHYQLDTNEVNTITAVAVIMYAVAAVTGFFLWINALTIKSECISSSIISYRLILKDDIVNVNAKQQSLPKKFTTNHNSQKSEYNLMRDGVLLTSFIALRSSEIL
uniref:Uncharacterized protein n=1 Tax=Glossina pallidipes TaxID=7398 RepID=A0A1B0A6K8_GLOPL